ncbi:MAG: MraY family glycosyltransferase [Planctomycetota bacterium]|nr:MraY family glycosyltransferase [Planctomycetota bacterium]
MSRWRPMVLAESADSLLELARMVVGPIAIALAVTLVATPVVRRLAIAWSLYDRPDDGLKPHDRPIPYLGGLAMYLGWVVALIYVAISKSGLAETILYVIAGGTILMLTGLVDDIRHIRPGHKLFIQAVAAVVLLWGGIGDGLIHCLFAGGDATGETTSGAVALAAGGVIMFFIIAGAGNAINLIDGMDGLCAGVVAIAALGQAVLAGWLVGGPDGGNAAEVALVLAAVLFATCAGFLRYNSHPARIFMGDCGSLLLGFSAAVLIILSAHGGSLAVTAGSIMIFGFPVFDTALAIARRGLNGKPLFTGDRSHFYDQLRDRGLSVGKTVLICYSLGIIFTCLGTAVIYLRTVYWISLYAAVILLAVVGCRLFGLLRVDDSARRSEVAEKPPT